MERVFEGAPPEVPYSERLDYDNDGNLIYHGKAKSSSGASEGAAVWSIRKLTYSDGVLTAIQWADGNSGEDNIWQERENLTYV